MQDDFMMVNVTVNGMAHRLVVEPRLTLLDMLRDELGLTGTNAHLLMCKTSAAYCHTVVRP